MGIDVVITARLAPEEPDKTEFRERGPVVRAEDDPAPGDVMLVEEAAVSYDAVLDKVVLNNALFEAATVDTVLMDGLLDNERLDNKALVEGRPENEPLKSWPGDEEKLDCKVAGSGVLSDDMVKLETLAFVATVAVDGLLENGLEGGELEAAAFDDKAGDVKVPDIGLLGELMLAAGMLDETILDEATLGKVMVDDDMLPDKLVANEILGVVLPEDEALELVGPEDKGLDDGIPEGELTDSEEVGDVCAEGIGKLDEVTPVM